MGFGFWDCIFSSDAISSFVRKSSRENWEHHRHGSVGVIVEKIKKRMYYKKSRLMARLFSTLSLLYTDILCIIIIFVDIYRLHSGDIHLFSNTSMRNQETDLENSH